MKRIIRTVAIAMICGLLAVPQIEAQGRRGSGDRGNNRPTTSAPGRGGQGSRPGGDRPTGNRPGNQNNGGQQHGNRPPQGGNHNPGGHHAPGRPAPGRPAPARPNRPPHHAYHRPTPPASYRPHHGCPVVHGILGITLGTTLHLSLDYLYNSGYSINSYGDNVVYLRDVRELNYYWNDATLYYGNGGLVGSEFYYTTNYYDMTRYNTLYNTFVGQYGSPVSYQAVNNGVVATWFGYNNQYVSIQFAPMYASNGQLRYVTTLSYGI